MVRFHLLAFLVTKGCQWSLHPLLAPGPDRHFAFAVWQCWHCLEHDTYTKTTKWARGWVLPTLPSNSSLCLILSSASLGGCWEPCQAAQFPAHRITAMLGGFSPWSLALALAKLQGEKPNKMQRLASQDLRDWWICKWIKKKMSLHV